MKKEIVIVLERSDLNDQHKNTPIYNLSWTYFNINKNEFNEASIVMFVEDGELVYLKNRYQKHIGFVTN